MNDWVSAIGGILLTGNDLSAEKKRISVSFVDQKSEVGRPWIESGPHLLLVVYKLLVRITTT
jgi:hypothetical protein